MDKHKTIYWNMKYLNCESHFLTRRWIFWIQI